MRKTISALNALLTALALAAPHSVSAEIMQCFGGAIDDAEVDRPTRQVVERRCGEPDAKDGAVWIYHTSQFVYRLNFNAKGALYLIERKHRK